MTEKLGKLETELRALEAAVVEALSESNAQNTSAPMVRVPEQERLQFLAALERLTEILYGQSGVKGLQLVSEDHDALRIRLIFFRNLLELDIPRRYAEEALEFMDPDAESKPIPEEPARKPVRPEKKAGFFLRLLAWFLGLFSRPGAKKPAVVKGRPGHALSRPTVSRTEKPYQWNNDELRLIYLHKLMEEDSLNLLPTHRRPAELGSDVRVPTSIANFTAKDFAENHFAVRVTQHKEKIARTPEELRAKLAKRAQEGGGE